VVSVKHRNDFKEAIRAKLILEVAGQTAERQIVPVVQSDPRVPCLIGEKYRSSTNGGDEPRRT
jgi:hypothetical protein